jgi:hypothetical protein
MAGTKSTVRTVAFAWFKFSQKCDAPALGQGSSPMLPPLSASQQRRGDALHDRHAGGLAAHATGRLRGLVAGAVGSIYRSSAARQPGTEGTRRCKYGRGMRCAEGTRP